MDVSNRLRSATPRPNVLLESWIVGLEEDLNAIERRYDRLGRACCQSTGDARPYDIFPALFWYLSLPFGCLSRDDRFLVRGAHSWDIRFHRMWFVGRRRCDMAGMLPRGQCGHRSAFGGMLFVVVLGKYRISGRSCWRHRIKRYFRWLNCVDLCPGHDRSFDGLAVFEVAAKVRYVRNGRYGHKRSLAIVQCDNRTAVRQTTMTISKPKA